MKNYLTNMKKLLLLIFGILVALPAMTQTQLVEISRIYKHIDINVTNGLVYKWVIGPEFDTARYFQHNGKRFIATVMFTEIGPVEPPTTNIDTVDGKLATFFPTTAWKTGNGSNWYGGSIAFSNLLNSTVTYGHPKPFSKIEIYAERKSTHGIIAVSIDGGPETFVDLYSALYQQKLLIHTITTVRGMHSVRIRVTGNKNPASSATYGLLDFFVITE